VNKWKYLEMDRTDDKALHLKSLGNHDGYTNALMKM
jgi:hypothetical protein